MCAALSLGGLYLYRSLELGRMDAQPAFLEPLNPGGELLGPEGICIDRQGNLLVGDARGILWNLGRGGKPVPIASLVPGLRVEALINTTARGRATGIAVDHRGNIFAVFRSAEGSSLTKIETNGNSRVIADSIGAAAALTMTDDDSSIWVADCRPQGRILRYALDGTAPVLPNLTISGLRYPAGVALGKDSRALYVAERDSGSLMEVDLGARQPTAEKIADLSGRLSMGSLASLAFDPRDTDRRFLYAAENLRGMITVVDVATRPPRIFKHLRLTLMGGRICPRGLVIQDGNLYCTDLWTCNPFRLALGFPKWQGRAYRFRVLDPAAFR